MLDNVQRVVMTPKLPAIKRARSFAFSDRTALSSTTHLAAIASTTILHRVVARWFRSTIATCRKAL